MMRSPTSKVQKSNYRLNPVANPLNSVSLAHLARKAAVTGSLAGDAVCCASAAMVPCFLNVAAGRMRSKIRADHHIHGNVGRGE